MKKTIVSLMVGVFIGAIICFLVLKNRIPKDFAFFEKVPQFTLNEKKFIRKNICTIFANLEEPERFYINHVKLNDSVVVDVSLLGSLQDGANSNQTVVSTSFDQTIRLIFNRDGEFISKNGDKP
ncbi:MAG TPA: hypothetical protein VKX35_06645 [Fermentimonas sp.]|nr:hypothetical protein [Fermentimonas sp.]